jgi:hypothetical protein
MITCQHEWIEQCQLKYRGEPLPEGEHWEDAHYPTPKCLGGTETVRIWSRDHAVHGPLQSEEFNYPCIWGDERILLETYYPEYLTLWEKWKYNLCSLGGSKGGPIAGPKTLLMGVGIHGMTFLEKSAAGKKGGAIAGQKNLESGHIQELGRIQGTLNVESGHLDRIRQLVDPVKQSERARSLGLKHVASGHLDRIRQLIDPVKRSERSRELGKRTGPISGRRHAESGHCKRIAHLGGLVTGKMAAEKLNTTQWLCMVTGKISTKGPLTMYQKSLGIDPRLKARVDSLLSQQLPIIIAGI